MTTPHDQRDWRTSSFSGGAGNCVEIRMLADGGRQVRDSKDPGGPVLTFTPAEWSAFVDGTRAGEFD